MKLERKQVSFAATLAILFMGPLILIFYKLYVLDYPLVALTPTISHQVELLMSMDGHGEPITNKTYIPVSDFRQLVQEEENVSGIYKMDITTEGLNRVATWTANDVLGRHSIRYTYLVQSKSVMYKIPEQLPIPGAYPPEFNPYLESTDGIQKDSPLIAAKIDELFPKKSPLLLEALTRIHRMLQDDFSNRDFSGYTDAITALKLGEASCNGKSRLFAALARHLNIPARLVGGIILQSGSKRTSHQWVEVYINGHWVPFDTINDHFAQLPANFLTLYYGDQVLFTHTANINFHYSFSIAPKLVPHREVQESLQGSKLNIINLYRIFETVGISQNLLKIILMIPLGALVTVIFRNVVGLETFGTFLPALIAAASRETGLVWGCIGFVTIIIISSLIRKGLEWMQLLHSPKMGVMLTSVVIILMSVTVAGVHFRLLDLAHITLFPIAILAITAERFAIIEMEQGIVKALTITGATLVVVAACYMVMASVFLQSLILAFPELLFVVIALNIWIGKWVGIRVMEFIRFRKLIFSNR